MIWKVAIGIAGLVIVLSTIAAAVYGPALRRDANVGAGFLAKQMCSCLYVAGRDFDGCRADMMEAMDAIPVQRFSEGERTGVRAGVAWLGFERVALHRAGTGCTLD